MKLFYSGAKDDTIEWKEEVYLEGSMIVQIILLHSFWRLFEYNFDNNCR